MRPEEMVAGNFYVINSWIVHFLEIKNGRIFGYNGMLYPDRKVYHAGQQWGVVALAGCRPATILEKLHLLECQEAGRYVDPPIVEAEHYHIF